MERNNILEQVPRGLSKQSQAWPSLQLASVPAVCSCTHRLGPQLAPAGRNPLPASHPCKALSEPPSLGTFYMEHFSLRRK